MARSEHTREAYRALFGYVGAGLQTLAAIFVLVSIPIAPAWMTAALAVAVIAGSWWSWRRYRDNFMMPTLVGTAQTVAWMVLVGVGVGILGWGR